MSRKQWGHGYFKGTEDMLKLKDKLSSMTSSETAEMFQKIMPNGEVVREFYIIPKDEQTVICHLKTQRWRSFNMNTKKTKELMKDRTADNELLQLLGVL